MAHNFKPWDLLPWTRYAALGMGFPAANQIAYVGKASTPGAGNGTPDSPFNTLLANAPYVQIGTGQYVATGLGGTSAAYMVADGFVTVRGPGSAGSTFSGKGTYVGLDISGFDYITNTQQGTGGNSATRLLRCILRGGQVHIFNDVNVSNQELMDCIVLNTACYIYSTGYLGSPTEHVSYNIFINSPLVLNPVVPLLCNYFDANSPITIYTNAGSTASLPQKCNIRGTLTIDGVLYANLAAAAVAWPALLTKGNINSDANFNRLAAEDFTLKLSSPHLDLGIGPRQLGYALMYYIEFDGIVGELCTTQNTRLRSTADGSTVRFLSIEGYTVNEQGALVIVANSQGNYEGSYTTDRIRVASTAQPIDSIPVIFQANFDADYPTAEAAFSSAVPEVYNNNVPAYANNSSGSAGRNPRRHTVRARFSPNLSPDVTQSGDWALGVWMDYEIGQVPTYNAATGTGNGTPSFDYTPANQTQMVARWVQLSYRSRNNYFSR